jgi:Domain of unknown function (DUF4157)
MKTLAKPQMSSPQTARAQPLQRAAVNSEPVSEIPPIVHEVLQSSGEPLDRETRAFFEPRFGHNFSQVRVHTDTKAAESARTVNALAYTVGRDIAFREGQYVPSSAALGLLAHELTHVVQQSHQAISFLQCRPPWLDESDDLEREAGVAERDVTQRRGSTLSYREAMQTVPPPRVRPSAARVQDTRERVLATERAMFNDLRTFTRGLPPQLRQLASTAQQGEPWLSSSNPNVQSALRVLDNLVTDLEGERFVIRFDQPQGTNVAASYDYLNNVMHLRTFSGREERTLLLTDLLHEYTHILQDYEVERIFARQVAPRVHTREEDLGQEIGARREQVYFSEMLRVLGEPVPTNAIFGARLSDMVFRGRFERERTASTPRERAAATREIRSEIETAYQNQLQTNSSIKTYTIELESNNHATLHWDVPGRSSPRDLGAVPSNFTQANQLQNHLSGIIRQLPEFSLLFNRSRGQTFSIVTFSILFDGDQITEFGMQP